MAEGITKFTLFFLHVLASWYLASAVQQAFLHCSRSFLQSTKYTAVTCVGYSDSGSQTCDIQQQGRGQQVYWNSTFTIYSCTQTILTWKRIAVPSLTLGANPGTPSQQPGNQPVQIIALWGHLHQQGCSSARSQLTINFLRIYSIFRPAWRREKPSGCIMLLMYESISTAVSLPDIHQGRFCRNLLGSCEAGAFNIIKFKVLLESVHTVPHTI